VCCIYTFATQKVGESLQQSTTTYKNKTTEGEKHAFVQAGGVSTRKGGKYYRKKRHNTNVQKNGINIRMKS